MTIDQFGAAFAAAAAGLGGEAPVVFKALTSKGAGVEFSEVNDMQQVGAVMRVYPAPATPLVAAHVVIEFA